MGLAIPALRFLAHLHKRQPFGPSVLTLGRQNVYATYDEVEGLVRAAGVAPHPLPEGVSTATNIPAWRGTPMEGNTSDAVFFRMLGCVQVAALDYSDAEGAELIWDLNEPVPAAFEKRFDLVLDGGTLEHVFNTRQAFANVARMVKPGGRVVHMSPTCNYVNHGFYQFSPTLFFDYYSTNGFTGLEATIVEHNIYRSHRPGWRLRPVTASERVISAQGLLTAFVAVRTAESTSDRVPVQSFYRNLAEQSSAPAAEGAPGGALPQRLWRGLSEDTRLRILGMVPWADQLRRQRGKRWYRL